MVDFDVARAHDGRTVKPTRRRRTAALALALTSAVAAGCGTSALGGPGAPGASDGSAPSGSGSSEVPGASDTPGDSPTETPSGRGERGGATPGVEPDDPATSSTPRVLPGTAVPTDYTAPRRQPNILLVTVDDAARGDLRYMPNVRRTLIDQGTTFPNAIAPTPICVPARASLLTGQYAHHHGAVTITGEGGGFNAFKDGRTLPTWLQRAGYDTMFVGKYLNGYGDSTADKPDTYVPPGWDEWRGSLDPTTYDYSLARQNVDGKIRTTRRYNTDVFADDTDQLLAQPARRKAPWYLWVNYVAPHFGGPVDRDDPLVKYPNRPRVPRTASPAPRDRNRFEDLPLPRTPNMFERDVSDKPPPSPARVRTYDRVDRKIFREERQQRIEALQSVDRAVAGHVATLRRTGQLDDTLVVLTSDNGFVVGEHNIEGKLWHYSEITGIPVVMRGPGIPQGQTRPVAVTNPDLPVTFSAVAGADPLREVDGINVLAHLGRDPGTRVVPIEAYQVNATSRAPLYTGVRVGPWTYVRYRRGGEEVYDHTTDRYELRNLAKVARYRPQVNELRRLTRTYRDCEGATCPQSLYR